MFEEAATGNWVVIEVQFETKDNPYFNFGESAQTLIGYSYLVNRESGVHVVELKTFARTPMTVRLEGSTKILSAI